MKLRKILNASLVLVLIAFIAGCQFSPRRLAYEQVTVGQTEMQLEQDLGKPSTIGASRWEYNELSYKVKIPIDEGRVAGKPVFEYLDVEGQDLYFENYFY